MRELTFRGFLKQYVRSLSIANTCRLHKLAVEASSDNPRLREPLLLYALFSGKEKVLLTATKSLELRKEYLEMLERHDCQEMEQCLRDNESALPDGYAKVYRSYKNAKNRSKNAAHTKLLMRDKIIRLQCEKHITNYRIYTDLHINHGNMNAFLKHGDCSKVSLDTARKAIAYMQRQKQLQ